MTGWIFDDSLTVCQPVQPVNQTRTWDKPPFMQKVGIRTGGLSLHAVKVWHTTGVG